MAYPSVVLDCPHCGAQLSHHVGPAQDAPWLCAGCGRGWWTAELSPQARRAWRPLHLDHLGVGVDTHLEIAEARAREHREAQGRRTSCREDHLPFLTFEQLDAIVRFLAPQAPFYPLCDAFLDRVREARRFVKPKGAVR